MQAYNNQKNYSPGRYFCIDFLSRELVQLISNFDLIHFFDLFHGTKLFFFVVGPRPRPRPTKKREKKIMATSRLRGGTDERSPSSPSSSSSSSSTSSSWALFHSSLVLTCECVF